MTRGVTVRRFALLFGALAIIATAMADRNLAEAAETALPLADKDVHMGVASCAGSTCHGAVQGWPNSPILQNEFITWQRKDKHAKAYQVLLNERSKRMAENLGLKSAHTADLCLDCHADNVPKERRHRTFQMSDGVGCEACHGGAGRWIGTHIAANPSHENNIANGLYSTAKPVERARLCLSCHFGDKLRFVTHRIMGAGHPRMSFELDTFTALQPAHFEADADYRQRKGNWNGVQVWAIGQAMAMKMTLDALLDPKMGRDGVFPELVLFDCHSCHRSLNQQRWQPRGTVGLGPGIPRLQDSNLLMLQVITGHVDPQLAQELRNRGLALHKASRMGNADVEKEARALRDIAQRLVQRFEQHKFGKSDMRALLDGTVKFGLDNQYTDYSGAEQATMALSTIVSAMADTGGLNKDQQTALRSALDGCYKAVENDDNYDPKQFVAALREFSRRLP
jgi:hypothetical protein